MKRPPLRSGWCQAANHTYCRYQLGTERHPAQCRCKCHQPWVAMWRDRG